MFRVTLPIIGFGVVTTNVFDLVKCLVLGWWKSIVELMFFSFAKEFFPFKYCGHCISQCLKFTKNVLYYIFKRKFLAKIRETLLTYILTRFFQHFRTFNFVVEWDFLANFQTLCVYRVSWKIWCVEGMIWWETLYLWW